MEHHTMQAAAALSYYFGLSIFPALIAMSTLLGFVPLPDLFGHLLVFMGRLLPREAMRVIYSVLSDVLSSHRGAWLSFGMLGTIWVVSSAFDATIEALDMAYDVKETRPFWKTRLLAILLAAFSGGLLVIAFAVMILGPRFGDWLAHRLPLSALFTLSWPVLHWLIAVSFTIIAVETIYFIGPNVKQRFRATLPGAVLSVTAWIGLAYLLGIYFRHFANYSVTYGTLGGFVACMTWLYWNSFVLLVGAELNAELARESHTGPVQQRNEITEPEKLDRAA
jgi:membrane protein